MVERIYISELQKMLHYKDRRSVRKWCRNNGIKVYCDFGSNRQYVLKEEFETAKIKIYYLLQNGFKSTEQPIQKQQTNDDKVCEDKPKGVYELNFLNFLQNI